MDTSDQKASYRFFENRDCEFYPCHQGVDEINCLFCFCPFYRLEECPGNPAFKTKEDGRRIKVCTGCTFPHKRENYDVIMKLLKDEARSEK